MEDARQGGPFMLPQHPGSHIFLGGVSVDEIRVAEVLNFSILWARTKEQPLKVRRSW